MKIRITGHGGAVRSVDLFETFAALARNEVADFPALRAHQRHPWHAFVVQVAAQALLRAGEATLPDTADAWRAHLLSLTPDFPNGEAWSLVGDDWDKPALLQPPGMEKALRKAGKRAATPDELDMLLTARNHDLKSARMGRAGDDDWLFALVSLQTQEGQMGAGNYGISRMNGGYGARVGIGLRPAADTPGAAFRRDAARLVALRPKLEDESAAQGDIGLVWLLPWDGSDQIAFPRLDPYYVEVCRRVRLVGGSDGIECAVVANSKKPRIAQALKGMTGDPWAPVLGDGTKSWGVSATGFGYRRMADLLNTKLPPLAEPTPHDGASGLTLLARAVTRGQGKTEGYHERAVAVPAKGARLLGGAQRDRLANVVKVRQEAAAKASNILRHALFVLHQGGAEKARLDDPVTKARVERFERRLDQRIDASFFDDAFWAHATFVGPPEVGDAAALATWRRTLADEARLVFREAIEAAPRTQMRRLRAVTRASGILEARLTSFVDPDRARASASARQGVEGQGAEA